jgi:uroporphyrin-III C-methyltransferase
MRAIHNNPTLTLIGAGPGDPDLITLKGVKALNSAKVILYDALVHTDLLNHASEDCIKVYVGKRSGVHSYKQKEINDLIVKYAYLKGSVVRLKGGDPMVFGRAEEEIEHASKFGIISQIIPGLSSSTSLPGQYGIHLTSRGVNESFWVVTGTTANGEISPDFYLAAKSSATVVVLMGRKKLGLITEFYKEIGKGNLSIAVIQNGSLKSEKSAIGTINNIESRVLENKIGTPAIIIIGDAVKKISEKNSTRNRYAQLN